jgi:hypothetical protein
VFSDTGACYNAVEAAQHHNKVVYGTITHFLASAFGRDPGNGSNKRVCGSVLRKMFAGIIS